MPIAYAQPSDCIDIVPALSDSQEESLQLEAALMQSLLDASRLIETDLILPVDYFAPASNTFTTKQFSSSRTTIFRVFPYTEVQWIKDADDVLIESDEYLFSQVYDVNDPREYYFKWQWMKCGRTWNIYPLSISAKWGFPCIPPDVTVAVKHMGCLMFLNNAVARIGQNEASFDDNQEQRLRQTYNRILDSWSNKLHHRLGRLGIG